jgi:uncharacterized protein (TIGR02246 family)
MRGMTMATIAMACMAAAPAHAADPAEAGMRAVMLGSAAAWNAGDLERFTAIYAPDAVFVGKKGLIRGRAAIAENYRPSFVAGSNRRGQLRFEFLGLKPIGERRILFARWVLSGGAEEESGMTTLVFERRADGWKILTDHSS